MFAYWLANVEAPSFSLHTRCEGDVGQGPQANVAVATTQRQVLSQRDPTHYLPNIQIFNPEGVRIVFVIFQILIYLSFHISLQPISVISLDMYVEFHCATGRGH